MVWNLSSWYIERLSWKAIHPVERNWCTWVKTRNRSNWDGAPGTCKAQAKKEKKMVLSRPAWIEFTPKYTYHVSHRSTNKPTWYGNGSGFHHSRQMWTAHSDLSPGCSRSEWTDHCRDLSALAAGKHLRTRDEKPSAKKNLVTSLIVSTHLQLL